MKRFYFRFRISLLTLALGLSSVNFVNWLVDYQSEVMIDLPRIESETPISVLIIDTNLGNNNQFDLKDRAAFTFIGIGCGGKNKYGGEGSVAGYYAYNWQKVAVNTSGYNNAKNAKREIDLRIKDASRVLESTTVVNKNSKSKESRTILEVENDRKAVEIITYDGRNGLFVITAPTLKLALEFEKWQEYRNNLIKDIK